MIRLDVCDNVGVLVVTTDLATEGTLVAKVPGSRYQRKGDHWTLPKTIVAHAQLAGIAGPHLAEAPEGVARWLDLEQRDALMVENAKRVRPSLVDAGEMHHQTRGLLTLGTARRCILGDEPGLGKTYQALKACVTPALVLCPKTLTSVWEDEAAKWRPEWRVQVVSGTAAQRRKQLANTAHLYVIGYESAVKHTRLAPFGSTKLTDDEKADKELNARAWLTVICDEAHLVGRNPAAKRTRAAWHLADGAGRVYALTGTPGETPSHQWGLLRLVAGATWPVKSKHLDRYALIRYNAWGQPVEERHNPETKAELDALVAPFFLRRTKDEVLDLPEKTYSVRRVEMAPRQAKAYNEMKATFLAELDSGDLMVAANPAVRFLRLLQLASATPANLEGSTLELTTPSCKVDAALDLADELAGEPVVSFCHSRRLSRLIGQSLAKAGHRVDYLDGAEPPGRRGPTVERFQAGELDWLFCTYGAGGVGVTLHRARTMVRFQATPSLVEWAQAEDRIHRVGQRNACHYIDVTTDGTAEDRVRRILDEKEEGMEAVCRDRERLRGLVA